MKGVAYRIIITTILLAGGVVSEDVTPKTETSDITTDSTTIAATTQPATQPTTQTATTTPQPTTTTTVAPTTQPLFVIGSDCNSTNECSSGISGNVTCNANKCSCVENHFPANESTCLPVSLLVPAFTDRKGRARMIEFKFELDSQVKNLNLTYSARAFPNEGTDTECEQVDIKQNSFKCQNLLPGTQYTIEGEVKFGVYMKTGEFIQNTKPVPPANVNVTALERSATLVWSESEGRADYYIVTVKGGMHTEETNDTYITISPLDPANDYLVSIVAYSYSHKSDEKNVSFRTLSDVPGPPTNFSVTIIGETSVCLEWRAPVEPNGPIQAYEICHKNKVYNDTDFTDWECVNTTDTTTNHGLTQLTAGTFYVFTIYTVNDRFKSNASDELYSRTTETAPGKVEEFNVIPGNQSLNATWKRPVQPNGDIQAYCLTWKKIGASNIERTVFLKTMEFEDRENSTCTSSDSVVDITTNQHIMMYSIDGLEDYQNYTVSVTAYNNKGRGNTTTKDQQTSIAKPEPVTNVTVQVDGPTSATVNWALPNDNPGPVTYVVQFKDMVVDSSSWQSWNNCTYQGKDWTNCTLEDLNEFWRYSVRVKAFTEAGDAYSDPDITFITHEGVPGPVSEVFVLQSTGCDATSIKLKWSEPPRENRNSNITKYGVMCSPPAKSNWNYDVTAPKPFDLQNREFQSNLDKIFEAESNYICKIYAVSKGGIKGTDEEFNVTTKSCLPVSWEDGGYADIKLGESTTTAIKVTYPIAFFTNDEQGQITERGFRVTKDKSDLSSVSVSQTSNWNTAKQNGFESPYKIKILPDQLRKKRKRSVPQNIHQQEYFVIGANSSCSLHVDDFCNGPLPSGAPFHVEAYACSSAGCSRSKVYGPFVTSVPPTDTGTSGWVAAVVVLAIIAVLLLAVMALMYFRGIDPRGWLKKSNAAPAQDKLEDELDNIQIPVEIPKHRPLSLARYDEELEALRRDTNLNFSDQYVDIHKLSEQVKSESKVEAAISEPNKAKNRWVNVLPYDHSRVKLQQLDEDDPSSDYINANYIPGYNTRREYIATQGPLPGTVDDFWRMVWEHNVQMIVMLTQCKEGNRVKCEMYWPDVVHEPKQYGDVVVNPVSVSTVSKYNITIFDISVNNQHRQVFHFHYLHFPDFSANVEFDVFIEFVHMVRSHVPHDMAGPIVVHCSAGVGRTGTFIGVDRLDQYIRSDKFSFNDHVDIFDMVMSMRRNRDLMVQTESQYIMIHDCLKLLLVAKKQAMEAESESDENLYANDGFDPYPEVLYENINVNGEPKTEL